MTGTAPSVVLVDLYRLKLTTKHTIAEQGKDRDVMQGKRAVIIIAVCLLALVVLSSETKVRNDCILNNMHGADTKAVHAGLTQQAGQEERQTEQDTQAHGRADRRLQGVPQDWRTPPDPYLAEHKGERACDTDPAMASCRRSTVT
jgi:hypothetical protein